MGVKLHFNLRQQRSARGFLSAEDVHSAKHNKKSKTFADALLELNSVYFPELPLGPHLHLKGGSVFHLPLGAFAKKCGRHLGHPCTLMIGCKSHSVKAW